MLFSPSICDAWRRLTQTACFDPWNSWGDKAFAYNQLLGASTSTTPYTLPSSTYGKHQPMQQGETMMRAARRRRRSPNWCGSWVAW